MAKKAASLNPDDFTEGGGLVDDIDATVTGISFVHFDYNGKVDPPVPAIKLELEDSEGDEHEEHFSAGKPTDWTPSDDGTQLVAIGQATGINATSKAGLFLKGIIDAGFPADQLGDSIEVVTGLQAHFIRVPAPKRSGLKKKAREDGRDFAETVLVVSEILSLPGEKKKPKGAAGTKKKASPKKKAAKKKGGDDAVADKTAEVIVEILEDAGIADKKSLPAAIFKLRKEDEDRNDMVKMALDEEFLESRDEWTFDDGNLIPT